MRSSSGGSARAYACKCLIATCAGVTITIALASPANATFPGTNGRIAYDSQGSLYTIKPDGTGDRIVFKQSLTDPEFILTAAGLPQWSANGTRLLYEREYGEGGAWYAL